MGHFESLSLPMKHKQELLQHQTSWFYKDLRSIQLVTQFPKILMDMNLDKQTYFGIFWALFWPVTYQTKYFSKSDMFFLSLYQYVITFWQVLGKYNRWHIRYLAKNVIFDKFEPQLTPFCALVAQPEFCCENPMAIFHKTWCKKLEKLNAWFQRYCLYYRTRVRLSFQDPDIGDSSPFFNGSMTCNVILKRSLLFDRDEISTRFNELKFQPGLKISV